MTCDVIVLVRGAHARGSGVWSSPGLGVYTTELHRSQHTIHRVPRQKGIGHAPHTSYVYRDVPPLVLTLAMHPCSLLAFKECVITLNW